MNINIEIEIKDILIQLQKLYNKDDKEYTKIRELFSEAPELSRLAGRMLEFAEAYAWLSMQEDWSEERLFSFIDIFRGRWMHINKKSTLSFSPYEEGRLLAISKVLNKLETLYYRCSVYIFRFVVVDTETSW